LQRVRRDSVASYVGTVNKKNTVRRLSRWPRQVVIIHNSRMILKINTSFIRSNVGIDLFIEQNYQETEQDHPPPSMLK
jgi:hypothetical protein